MIDSSRDASCALAAGGSKLARNPGWLLTLGEIRDDSPCPWTTSEVSGKLSDFAVWEESDIDIHEVGAYKYNICGILYTMPGAGGLAGTLCTLGGKELRHTRDSRYPHPARGPILLAVKGRDTGPSMPIRVSPCRR